jgi:hypothetical protein
MSILKIEKQKYFIAFAGLQVIFACVIIINEFFAASRGFPMNIFHIEHGPSWGKVLLYCGCAIMSIFVGWLFTSKQHLSVFVPSVKFVLVAAVFLTLSGVFAPHYLSVLESCCEQSRTIFHFGFPFSFVLGIAGYDYFLMPHYTNYVFLEVLNTSDLLTFWNFLPYQFFLNLLFWSNIIFVFVSSSSSFLIQRKKYFQIVNEQVQSAKTRKIISFAITGLFLSIVCLTILATGGFTSWRNLSIGSEEYDYDYVSSILLAENGQRFSEYSSIEEPCDYSLPEFYLIAFPPKNIADCAHFYEILSRTTYIRDTDGNLWEWSNPFFLLWSLYPFLCCSFIGLFFGAIIAVYTQRSVHAEITET